MKKCPEAFAYYMYQRNTENSEKLLTLSNLYHILQKEKHNTIMLTPNKYFVMELTANLHLHI